MRARGLLPVQIFGRDTRTAAFRAAAAHVQSLAVARDWTWALQDQDFIDSVSDAGEE